MRSVRVTQPQSWWPAPQPENKERDKKRAWQTKVVDVKLVGFVDWAGVLADESAKEEEMSMLAVGFAAWMQKQTADSEDELTPIPDGKPPRRSSPCEGVEKDWAIIPVDFVDQDSND